MFTAGNPGYNHLESNGESFHNHSSGTESKRQMKSTPSTVSKHDKTDSKQDLSGLLVDIATTGNRYSYEKLFKLFSPRILHYGLRYFNQEAQALELVQETMLTVWRKAHLFNPEKASGSTWLYAVTRNQCFDLLRKQQSNREQCYADDLWSIIDSNDSIEGPANAVDLHSQSQGLLKYLDHLPQLQQEVVIGLYLKEMTHQQLSEQLNIPLGTVKSRLRLALEKLRDLMQNEQY